jgi:hypothetical protein
MVGNVRRHGAYLPGNVTIDVTYICRHPVSRGSILMFRRKSRRHEAALNAEVNQLVLRSGTVSVATGEDCVPRMNAVPFQHLCTVTLRTVCPNCHTTPDSRARIRQQYVQEQVKALEACLQACETSRIPPCLDTRLTAGGDALPPQRSSYTHFCWRQ